MALFVDEAEIVVKAGRGGDGAIAFLHEKYRPMGGPAGGDGGRGGDIILKADRNTSSLWEIARQRQFRAKNGGPGEGKNRHGKDGISLILKVPLGTLVREIKDGPILYDLNKDGAEVAVAKGGKGGKGNLKFATPTNRAPRVAEEGEDPEEKRLHLELRLIADVGLVGLPNAGKSTLISRVSAAHPKVAPYPFTTRRPELGVVSAGNFRNIVIADLPGLIEGAHKGVGLGDTFLRHIERTRLIAHLVELMPPAGTPFENYLSVRRELKLYSEELAKRPEIIVLTKADLDPDESLAKEFVRQFNALQKKKTKNAALVPPRLRGCFNTCSVGTRPSESAKGKEAEADNSTEREGAEPSRLVDAGRRSNSALVAGRSQDGVLKQSPKGADTFCVAISAVTGYNMDRLLKMLFDAVARLPAPEMR